MEVIDKFSAYSKLLEIKNKSDNIEEIDNHIKRVFSEDSVPYSTIVFINKYFPLEQLSIYNRIYENRRKNPLYKNLVNENLSTEDRVIALSSLLTQILINNKKLREAGNTEDAILFKEFMNADEISKSLHEYFNGSSDKVNEIFNMVRETFKRLY